MHSGNTAPWSGIPTLPPCFEDRDSQVYPLADTADPGVVRDLNRLEELYNWHFGVVYRSRYHILCVDPIRNPSGNGYFPYERLMPASGSRGVVIIPRWQGNFLLLRQYRHAPRAEQICFPRGFGEQDQTAARNAIRELEEELHAEVLNPPVRLGTLTADSGALASRTDVFLADVSRWENTKSEGIREVLGISEPRLADMIRDGQIEDGLTLSACTLYRAWSARA